VARPVAEKDFPAMPCPEPQDGRASWCAVLGHAAVSATPETLPALRQRPGPAFFKQSDEQTVVGLAAVYRALDEAGLDPASLGGWGVVAGPRFLGRSVMAVTLKRFAEEGAWGMSPHLIAHRSLHALSGTISQALGLHGPNFGAGGGPGADGEALLAAAALLADGELPGLWLVLTHAVPDALPTPEAPPPNWHALALALRPGAPAGAGQRLEVAAAPAGGNGLAPLDVAALARGLAANEAGGWRLVCGGRVRLHPAEGRL
jgi:hypothetical protein